MGSLILHCDTCKTNWRFYRRDDWTEKRICPVCGRKIDINIMTGIIRSAFKEMEKANLELAEEYAKRHGELFTVSYESDAIYPDSEGDIYVAEIREDIADLKDSIKSLKTLIENHR